MFVPLVNMCQEIIVKQGPKAEVHFAIWSLSSQRFHYFLYLSIVSWQYQKYWTSLILVLYLLCVSPLVCPSYFRFATSSPFSSSWWQKDCELFTHTLVLRCSPLTPLRQLQTIHEGGGARFLKSTLESVWIQRQSRFMAVRGTWLNWEFYLVRKTPRSDT